MDFIDRNFPLIVASGIILPLVIAELFNILL